LALVGLAAVVCLTILLRPAAPANAAACGKYAQADTPAHYPGGDVNAYGSVSLSADCAYSEGYSIYMERKVCPWYNGCSWQQVGTEVSGVLAPGQTTYGRVWTDCVGGTNRYRAAATISGFTSVTSAEPEFTC
jgi:hypothetical protein